jgi:hypothetical protein
MDDPRIHQVNEQWRKKAPAKIDQPYEGVSDEQKWDAFAEFCWTVPLDWEELEQLFVNVSNVIRTMGNIGRTLTAVRTLGAIYPTPRHIPAQPHWGQE